MRLMDWEIRYCVRKIHPALLQISFCNVTFPSMLHLFLMLFDKVFEVFTMVRIDNAVWVRTLCHLVRGY